MLSWLILLPIAGAIAVALVPQSRREALLPLGITMSALPLALAGYVFWVFEPVADYQFTEHVPWYEPWGMAWSLGIDGISMPKIGRAHV